MALDRSRGRLPLVLVLLVLGIALAACGAATRPSASTPPRRSYIGSVPPQGLHPAPFALRDQDASLITDANLHGKVAVITFLDTACRDSCPLIGSEIGVALRMLTPSERDQLYVVAFSVDPPADNPIAVRRFLITHRLSGRIHYLVARTSVMRPIWHAYGVIAAVQTGNADVHSADVRIFNRETIWQTTLRVGEDLTAAHLAHDVRVALRS